MKFKPGDIVSDNGSGVYLFITKTILDAYYFYDMKRPYEPLSASKKVFEEYCTEVKTNAPDRQSV